MAVFNQVAHSIGKRRETRLALNFLSDVQAIGDELVVFLIHPFDRFTKSPRMPQTVTKCESCGRFQPGGSFNRERRETRLALNILSDAQAIGVGLVAFEIHPFGSFMKSPGIT